MTASSISGTEISAESIRIALQQHQQDILASLLVSAWMVEARDTYTGGHLWRVSQFAMILARKADYPEAEVQRIGVAGFLHDLGKIGIPDAILGKPGRLTEEEYDVIKTHPRIGSRMLAGHPLASLVDAAVLMHHEMPNGKGYPLGLSGNDIPIDARIIGVCDAFDAMTSARPYRKGMPREQAQRIIDNNLGEQFDEPFGRLLIELSDAGELDHIIAHSDEGIPLLACPVCGPTIVRRRDQHAGTQLTCPSCRGAFVLESNDRTVFLERKATAFELEVVPDRDLINALVNGWARHYQTSALV
jgi:HD-GYP domain-containing protein (c-di-GMP phosphodiesterase class II)